MLNISPQNSIAHRVDPDGFRSFALFRKGPRTRLILQILTGSLLVLILILFLPWTQNVDGKGKVTTLDPMQRPQMVQAFIDGSIEKWHVREGQYVQAGDTLLRIREIKSDYLDPALLNRTESQIISKSSALKAYQDKTQSLDSQIDALNQTQRLKIDQAKNYTVQAQLKVQADSASLIAAQSQYRIAQRQFLRTDTLYQQQLKSRTQWEDKQQKMQESEAKLRASESKLLSSQRALINAQTQLDVLFNEYQDKLSKAQSERHATLSSAFDAEASITKMQNQYANYSARQGMYIITAPQAGYVTELLQSGVGETVKAGSALLRIMPKAQELAAEVFIRPRDIPLVRLGQKVRLSFDGWPAVIFSGWPQTSYGTFGAKVVAMDNFLSKNGDYRILVVPDPDDAPWPEDLRLGTGARGIALLQDVSLWYEMWRRINGFPPDYYPAEKAAVEAAAKAK